MFTSLRMKVPATTRRMLLVTLALLAPAAGGAQATGGGGRATTVRARCGNCAQSRDSVRMKHSLLMLKLDSLRYVLDHERLTDAEKARVSGEMSQTLVALERSLDEMNGSRGAVTARIVMERGGEEMRRAAPMVYAFKMRPRGYLGITFDGPSIDLDRADERIIRFLSYPRISLVEPRSPADRAGVVEGDTLIAFNGNDVIRQSGISLTKLLEPDAHITMRVRREGAQKDLTVVVGEAPMSMMSRFPMAIEATPAIPGAAPGALLPGMVAPRVRAAPSTPDMPSPPMPAVVQGSRIWVYSNGIWGAQVETIDPDGLGKALGVKSGVLVVRAEPGSLAAESGLHSGDIITNAAGKAVASVRELRMVLADADGDTGVKLVVLREKRAREITLRW